MSFENNIVIMLKSFKTQIEYEAIDCYLLKYLTIELNLTMLRKERQHHA